MITNDNEWLRQTVMNGSGTRTSFQSTTTRSVSGLFGTEALEWVQSIFPFVLGLLILSHPRIATGSILVVTFQVLHSYGTGLFMLVLGALGIAALVRRNCSVWLRIRTICSTIRSLTWLSFVLSMSFLTVDVGHISPMMVAYSVYAVGEVAVTYTLASHVRPS